MRLKFPVQPRTKKNDAFFSFLNINYNIVKRHRHLFHGKRDPHPSTRKHVTGTCLVEKETPTRIPFPTFLPKGIRVGATQGCNGGGPIFYETSACDMPLFPTIVLVY